LSLTVVALGGHLLAEGAEPRRALEPLLDGRPLAVTHGNGPQVGDELLRDPGAPLHVAVARTQGEIGSFLAGELEAACVVTHVVVDEDDPAFAEPTKPIGPWTEERPAGPVVHEAGRGWRRVVASPAPREIVELEAIRALLEAGSRVVCCGGGGIPVANGRGVDAVIDKDRASALLAAELGARLLVVLTDEDALYRDYRGPSRRPVLSLTPDEADALLPDLPAGSMRPKVEACAAFVRATGGEALITSDAALPAALAGEAGTRVAA
jgi:carbamate kinase